MPGRGFAVRIAAVALAGLLAGSALAGARDLRVPLDGGRTATLTEDQRLFLEAEPRRGEGLLEFAQRLTGTSRNASRVAEINGTRRLLLGFRYKVPFDLLEPGLQLEVVRGVFEADEVRAEGWEHRVRAWPGHEASSLWRVAEWFTGRGENYALLRAANSMVEDDLVPGRTVRIPAALLRPSLRPALPPDSPYHLGYGSDGRGEFAVYRLKPGEALYSSVVVRFTGTVFAEDVNSLAQAIAERSGIREVRDIPVGYEVRIPFEHLAPEFLPAGHPRRRDYEAALLASSRYSNPVVASRLSGVTVILDSGHGGQDVGAEVGGVWESVYVYDILVRTQRLLEATTAARVVPTIRDGDGVTVPNSDRLDKSRQHRILTTPNYAIDNAVVGVHLRWYLANSIFRQHLRAGGDPAKTIFLSIHADSLHPSLRGAMAYLPGARYRGGSYGKSGAVYASRREFQEKPRVSFAPADLVRAEGLSRQLAQQIIGAFAGRSLAVHPDRPVRERIIRKGRSWVPAVLRYNEVPSALLLEVCNLANEEDRRLIQTATFRQRVAESIVDGILGYYGFRDGVEAPQVAAR